jgi:hypothetical protein
MKLVVFGATGGTGGTKVVEKHFPQATMWSRPHVVQKRCRRAIDW